MCRVWHPPLVATLSTRLVLVLAFIAFQRLCFGYGTTLQLHTINASFFFFFQPQRLTFLPWTVFTDPQISLFNNFFIKNGFYGTIHIFKNYFATVFSVFSFQFQQNKFNPNKPLSIISIWLLLLQKYSHWMKKIPRTLTMNTKTCQWIEWGYIYGRKYPSYECDTTTYSHRQFTYQVKIWQLERVIYLYSSSSPKEKNIMPTRKVILG